MNEIQQILNASDALATLEYFENTRSNSKEQSPEQFIGAISEYSRSRPGRASNYHAINEATVVLLSAYLEGFIEDLHAEVMYELLDEKVRAAGVLDSLLEYAHKQFGNPTPDRIVGLFGTCGIENVISSRQIEKGKLSEFVKVRNEIAHGKRKLRVTGTAVEDWFDSIRRLAEALAFVVQNEISAMISSD